jgi:hypothetical protein
MFGLKAEWGKPQARKDPPLWGRKICGEVRARVCESPVHPVFLSVNTPTQPPSHISRRHLEMHSYYGG